jgi:hypothetical protein
MATGDILPFNDGAFGAVGSRTHQVASGTAASISAGELVLKTLGNEYVLVWTASNTAKPVAGTDFIAGVSTTASNETASLAGTVSVTPLVPGQVWLANPDTAATWNTQAKYNALVGARVLLSTTSGGVQTILATDGSTNGLVIENLDIKQFPGKVAFSVRAGCSYTA